MIRFIRLSVVLLAVNFAIVGAAQAATGHHRVVAKEVPAGLNCNEAVDLGTGADSPNVQYFKDLYTRGQAAIQAGTPLDLSEFLKLWYPAHGDGSNLDSPFFACEDQPMGAFTKADPTNPGAPAADCRPDILYSWGPAVKMDILTNMVDGQAWSGALNQGGQILNGTEFASISPVTTFGYGDYLFRFKIKKTTPYVFSSFGTTVGTIGVRQDMYHDFAIADSGVVESVSVSTPEIYDEVVRDLLRFESGKQVSAYNVAAGTTIDRLFNQLVDGHDQSQTHLENNLLLMIGQILNGQGVLRYNQGVCRNHQLTFSTAYPAYFEPLLSPNVPGQIPVQAAPLAVAQPVVQPVAQQQAAAPVVQDAGGMQPIPNPPDKAAAKKPLLRRVVRKPAPKRVVRKAVAAN
jgi:hypothetical protein